MADALLELLVGSGSGCGGQTTMAGVALGPWAWVAAVAEEEGNATAGGRSDGRGCRVRRLLDEPLCSTRIPPEAGGVSSPSLPERSTITSTSFYGSMVCVPPAASLMDEPLFSTQHSQQEASVGGSHAVARESGSDVVFPVILPIAEAGSIGGPPPQATTMFDLTFGEQIDDNADWLGRVNGPTTAGAPAGGRAGSSRGHRNIRDSSLGSHGPGSRNRSRSSRHTDRRPHHAPRVAWYPARSESIGAAFRDALVGRPRGEGPALFNLMTGTLSHEEVVLAVRRRVLAEVRRGVSFYIGITESPDRRWGEHCAAGGMRHWQMMLVLVQATTSSTTAAMEQLLLSEFGSRYQCHNVGPGGECASAGSPHFLYILLAQDGLLRRSY